MKEDKNKILIDQMNQYLKDNDSESIIKELPKVLKIFEKLSKRINRILKQSDSQQLEVLKLKEHIEDKNERINTLLNNAGQGFLYFNQDMEIGQEYSKEVTNIFKQDVYNQKINELLYQDDNSKAEFLKATLQSILNDIPMKQEILISLLEKEFVINNKFIEIQYKILNNSSFMLILTDVTANKKLAKKIKEEQQTLKMVIEAVTSLEQFLEVKQDYMLFIEKIDDFKTIDKLSDLRKEIHTYKGLFAQKEMLYIVDHLHQFESEIDNSLKENILNDKVLNITKETMGNWFEEDVKILKKILGDDFFDKSNLINIDKDRINNIIIQMKKLLKDNKKSLDNILYKEISNITHNIETLTYYPIELFFKPYKKLVSQLALKLEKCINPLVLEIEKEIYIPSSYVPFINSLVHIFRNSVDHGIEALDDRYETGKDEYGTIECKIQKIDNNIEITISDDGAGVDIEKIKNLAIKKDIYTQNELENFTEKDIVMIIFKDEFSTKDKVSTISGRGVGLASIISELDKIDGSMNVENNFGKGIKFTFTLKYNDEDIQDEKDEDEVIFVF